MNEEAIQLLRDIVLATDNHNATGSNLLMSSKSSFYTRATKIIAEEIINRGKYT